MIHQVFESLTGEGYKLGLKNDWLAVWGSNLFFLGVVLTKVSLNLETKKELDAFLKKHVITFTLEPEPKSESQWMTSLFSFVTRDVAVPKNSTTYERDMTMDVALQLVFKTKSGTRVASAILYILQWGVGGGEVTECALKYMEMARIARLNVLDLMEVFENSPRPGGLRFLRNVPIIRLDNGQWGMMIKGGFVPCSEEEIHSMTR